MKRVFLIVAFVCLSILIIALFYLPLGSFAVTSSTIQRSQCDDLYKLQEFEYQKFSQNGEDGVLIKLLEFIGMKNKYAVEFGVQDGKECNTRILREMGWDGLMMDGSHTNKTLNLQQEFITESNIIDLFEKHKVPREFDVLSVDVDTFDFWILSRLLSSQKFRPRIVIVEVNPTLCINQKRFTMEKFSKINSIPLSVGHPNMTKVVGKIFDGTRYYGANPRAYHDLGKRYGYEMVYCDRCSVNCFLIKRSELPQDCRRNIPFPFISYPCFATDTKLGAPQSEIGPYPGLYSGHLVDPHQRPATHTNTKLLDKLINSKNFSLSDIEDSSFSCVNHQLPAVPMP
jgi:hypothetical protein